MGDTGKIALLLGGHPIGSSLHGLRRIGIILLEVGLQGALLKGQTARLLLMIPTRRGGAVVELLSRLLLSRLSGLLSSSVTVKILVISLIGLLVRWLLLLCWWWLLLWLLLLLLLRLLLLRRLSMMLRRGLAGLRRSLWLLVLTLLLRLLLRASEAMAL